jgi:thymidylate synthase (FAD)
MQNEYHENLFKPISNDFGFVVNVLRATYKPHSMVYMSLHRCYSDSTINEPTRLSENDCGDIVVRRLLDGNRGHFSPFESVVITFAIEGLNHGTVQQLLRSRIGVSPSVQSFRYTNPSSDDIEKIFYFRPVGTYHDRETEYHYTDSIRNSDLELGKYVYNHVKKRIEFGMPFEQARGMMFFDYRQNLTITFNARSLMALFDRRSKKDAQIEIRVLMDMMFDKFVAWMPQTGQWYLKNRWSKARLSP